MKLRGHRDILAGCRWLARITDKVRAGEDGKLPVLYRLSLGNPLGVDGFFLRHFRISFGNFRKALNQA